LVVANLLGFAVTVLQAGKLLYNTITCSAFVMFRRTIGIAETKLFYTATAGEKQKKRNNQNQPF